MADTKKTKCKSLASKEKILQKLVRNIRTYTKSSGYGMHPVMRVWIGGDVIIGHIWCGRICMRVVNHPERGIGHHMFTVPAKGAGTFFAINAGDRLGVSATKWLASTDKNIVTGANEIDFVTYALKTCCPGDIDADVLPGLADLIYHMLDIGRNQANLSTELLRNLQKFGVVSHFDLLLGLHTTVASLIPKHGK